MKTYDIGLVDLWFAYNYGAQLSGLATYRILKSLGNSVLMINKPGASIDDREVNDPRIKEFTRKHYDPSDISSLYSYQDLSELNQLCDTFCVGSSHVWNYDVCFKKNMHLAFAYDEKKLISLSTSFGRKTDRTPILERPFVQELLQRFSAISVRDSFSKDICLNNYGINARELLSPVFCLNNDDYKEIASKSVFNNESDYLCAYILDPSPQKKELIESLCRILGLKAIIILHGSAEKYDKNRAILGLPNVLDNPCADDLLSALSNSSFVLTDSYYGTSFAIKLNKPFLTIKNEHRGFARIDLLLEKFSLESRQIASKDTINENRVLEKIDYDCVNSLIEEGAQETLNWIKEALSTNKKVDTIPIVSEENNLARIIDEIRKHSNTNKSRSVTEQVAYNIIPKKGYSRAFLNCEKAKVAKLREKIAKGERINVYFVINYISKFEFVSIFRAMLNSDIFFPRLLVVSPKDREYEGAIDDARQSYNYLISKGYPVEFAYDSNNKPIDLRKLDIDLLFINNPNMFFASSFNNLVLNYDFLTVYGHYGYETIDTRGYHFNNNMINTSWMILAYSNSILDRWQKYSWRKTRNVFCGGYPKFDLYKSQERALPQKLDNGKPFVIYAPHWTINFAFNISTFHKHFDIFAKLRETNPDINFVFKPHPDLMNRLRSMKRKEEIAEISYDQYLQYIHDWDNSDNGIYVNDGEYISLFKESSLLITDSGSFIAEYLPSCKPCIYILNPDNPKQLEKGFYTDEADKILQEAYYCCTSQKEILCAFNDIIHKKKDPKQDTRISLSKEIFPNQGESGFIIMKHIEKCLKEQE